MATVYGNPYEKYDQVVAATARYFDEDAEQYDAIAAASGWPFPRILSETLQNGPAPRNAADLGAGTGATIGTILEVTQPERIVAVDISQGMIAQLLRRFGQRRDIIAVHDDIDAYLLRTRRRFDLITAMGVMNYLPSLQGTIVHAAKRLKPLGRLAFTYTPYIPGSPRQSERAVTHDGGWVAQRHSPQEIEDSLLQSGLRLIREQRQAPHRPRDPGSAIGAFVVAQKQWSRTNFKTFLWTARLRSALGSHAYG